MATDKKIRANQIGTTTTRRKRPASIRNASSARKDVQPLSKQVLQQSTPLASQQPSPQSQYPVLDMAPSAVRPPSGMRHVAWSVLWPVHWLLRFLWSEKWRLVSTALVVVAVLFIPSEAFRNSTKEARYGSSVAEIQKVPAREIGIVFGAGVLPDHTPTEYLKHRIETSVDLYKTGHVKKLLMSGDNSTKHYDEPTAMKVYAIKLGVNPDDIILDYAGYNTYDTCYRANAVLKLRSATVITQGYHLPRAVMTCRDLGIDTIGVAARKTGRDWTVSYIIREHVATVKAYVQLLMHPKATITVVEQPLPSTPAASTP